MAKNNYLTAISGDPFVPIPSRNWSKHTFFLAFIFVISTCRCAVCPHTTCSITSHNSSSNNNRRKNCIKSSDKRDRAKPCLPAQRDAVAQSGLPGQPPKNAHAISLCRLASSSRVWCTPPTIEGTEFFKVAAATQPIANRRLCGLEQPAQVRDVVAAGTQRLVGSCRATFQPRQQDYDRDGEEIHLILQAAATRRKQVY